MKIKAISLWQPWAHAMKLKLKRNETRSWPTRYRGYLAIHAAKKPYVPGDYTNEFNLKVQGAGIWPHRLDYGAVVCVVKLVGCERTELVSERISERELFWGDYAPARFAWVTCVSNMLELPEAIPLCGHQGLFDWEIPDSLAANFPAEIPEFELFKEKE